MSRSLLPTIAASLALAIAGESAEALGQGPKKAGAPAAASAAAPAAASGAAPAAASGAAPAAAASANLTASVRDSGLIRLTWADTQGGADYVIQRTLTSGKDTVPEVKFRVPKGQLFYLDKSGLAGSKYSYTLHTQSGKSFSAPIDGKSVPANLPDPLTAKAAAGIPDEFVDGTKWSALGGDWMPDGVTFAQRDDSPTTPDETRDQKVSWIGSPCSADVEQVIAAVSLSGQDKLAPFANKLTPPAPAFRVGLGFTNSAKSNRAGVFFVVQGNLSAVTSAVFEPDQSGKPYATVTPDALSASDKFWIKIKFRKTAAGKKADLFAWVWKDGGTEPSDEALAFSCRGLDWPADPVYPALYGGLQAGTNQLSVAFNQILHETYTAAVAPAAPVTPTPTTHAPSAKPPCLVACRPEPPSPPASEPPPGLRFVHQWPNSAVAVPLADNRTPAGRWKLIYRGISVKRLDRTVEDELLLARGGTSEDGFGPANPDRPVTWDADSQKAPDRLFVFLGPAMFPLPGFENDCPSLEADGAIIQESMNLRARDSGEFEVEFRVSAPALPVTLRLELDLHRGVEDFGQITLPPMVLDTENLQRDEEQGDTWRVVYHGYSRALARALDWCGLNKPTARIEITRRGAARFGSGVSTVATYE